MLLIKESISKARKLIHDTLYSFKSFISGGYERLPNTPPFSAFSCAGDSKLHRSFRELDVFYNEFSDQWEGTLVKKSKKKDKKKLPMKRYESVKEDDQLFNGSFMKFVKMDSLAARKAKVNCREEEKRNWSIRREDKEAREVSSERMRVQVCNSVAQKLKELELMDANNVEHLLDIEEVLHYYSRITCPDYIDIFNKFFMEVYAEFLAQPSGGSQSRRIDWANLRERNLI